MDGNYCKMLGYWVKAQGGMQAAALHFTGQMRLGLRVNS